MVIGQVNCVDSKKSVTLYLKRINRLKCMQNCSLKRKSSSQLDILKDKCLSLWTSFPILYFFKTIGIAPVYIESEEVSIKFTLLSFVYLCALLVIYSSATLWFLNMESFPVHFLSVSPIVISSITIYWNSILSLNESRKLCLISGNLYKINKIMCSRNFEKNTSKGTISILLVAVILSCVIFFIDYPLISGIGYLLYVKGHLALVMVQLNEMHQKLKFCFKEVNRSLVKIVDRYDSQIYTVSSILPFVEIIGRTENVNHLTIPVLIDLHWTLCKTVTTVSELLGAKALLVIFSSCSRIINIPFFLINYWMYSDEKEIHFGIIVSIIVKVIKVITCLSEILLLIVPCILTAKEAKKTQVVICELMNKDLPTNIRKQLERSIKLLKLHSAETSAHGILKFDLSIMTSMAGVVTSYLIIFVQHQASIKSFLDTNKNGTQT